MLIFKDFVEKRRKKKKKNGKKGKKKKEKTNIFKVKKQGLYISKII